MKIGIDIRKVEKMHRLYLKAEGNLWFFWVPEMMSSDDLEDLELQLTAIVESLYEYRINSDEKD